MGTETTPKATSEGGLGAALAAKVEGDTPPADDKKPEDKPSGAPEKYEAWKVPEGHELDAGLVEKASPIFKELGLTQDQAQKLVDLYNDQAIKAAKTAQDALDSMLETRRGWVKEMKTDPVLGKLRGADGNFGPDSKLVQTINRALDGLQSPQLVTDFKAAMDLTGAGDHPAFVKVLHAMASLLTEGTEYAKGNPPKPEKSKPSAAAAIYPNLKPGS